MIWPRSWNTVAFQLTTSRRGRLPDSMRSGSSRLYFNSLPHAEVDGSLPDPKPDRSYFNSLPHAEVDKKVPYSDKNMLTFQLTTSRRGRRSRSRSQDTRKTFQLTTSRRGRQQFVTKSMDINHRFHNKSHNKSLFFALIILCLSIFH